jgi:hypothetical protein
MQSQQQRNSNFMITKEVFINHLPHQIEKHYDINPNVTILNYLSVLAKEVSEKYSKEERKMNLTNNFNI